MRSDMASGATFPDYELPDHERVPRSLTELPGGDPLILTLARGHYCPKEHQQHLELAANYAKIAGAEQASRSEAEAGLIWGDQMSRTKVTEPQPPRRWSSPWRSSRSSSGSASSTPDRRFLSG